MYIPERKSIIPSIPFCEKLKNEQLKNCKLTSQEIQNIKKEIETNFAPIFNTITLTQLERFSQEIKSRNYSFESNDIKAFVKEQIRREIGVDFYKEFSKRFLENTDYSFQMLLSSDIDNIKILNKEIIYMLKLYMRATLGKIRIEEKLK